jgi:hypothetical protein
MLLLLAGPVVAADVTSTRTTSYDWQTQDANGVKIQDYARQDTAIVGCINTPTCVFIVGGKYKITRATVTNPPPATGSAALSWTAPSKNTDGSALTTVTGYKVYHGTNPNALTDVVQVTGTSYTFNGLASGTHYFAVSTLAGVAESAQSAIGNKVIP